MTKIDFFITHLTKCPSLAKNSINKHGPAIRVTGWKITRPVCTHIVARQQLWRCYWILCWRLDFLHERDGQKEVIWRVRCGACWRCYESNQGKLTVRINRAFFGFSRKFLKIYTIFNYFLSALDALEK